MRSWLLPLVASLLAAAPSFAGGARPLGRADDTLLDQALFVGGADDDADMTALRRLYHARIDPIVRLVRGQPPEIAAKLLLHHLHESYGGTRAVLTEYVVDASSLNQTLITGKYNCVAATQLFLLAARDAGLDVEAELYDTHARPVMRFAGRWIQIEATDAFGVDTREELFHPTGVLQQEVAIELPHPVSTQELLATVYTNAVYFGLPVRSAKALADESAGTSTGWASRMTERSQSDLFGPR